MTINPKKLKKAVANSSREELLALIEKAVDQLDANSLFLIFEDFYKEKVMIEQSDEDIKLGLIAFRDKSLKGLFFDYDWEWTSKTYDTITPLTQSWYDEVGFWLDIMSEKALQQEKELARFGFELLIDLIGQLDGEGIIIPHNSVGEENIFSKYDYRKLFNELN